eukprot:CAMPEP_0176341806 /NCGR_PEP_ID=MMETSP0126-20121128/2671_1 /TAXON_ID=141414 ORGANISM="Strombidinopsis acuminatum, Strain SPMC142" /NCGR_SAMPLE_ID=MMETSP0126 /ASSEMBLY_ACC=CAM_ASM_000229 /LENGTH=41 /DNA_ID= /DNA_START= /DNA_END= /DNA_ORIENTATION=
MSASASVVGDKQSEAIKDADSYAAPDDVIEDIDDVEAEISL